MDGRIGTKMPKPTATTFFASRSNADKAKIQGVFDAIERGSSRDKILSELSGLTSQMGGAERDQLVSMVYSQLAAR